MWIDALKFFAIFLVLWGHCIQYFLSSFYLDEPVYRFIYSFHMPLFMMVSGYLFGLSTKRDIRLLIKNKSIQLLLPVLSWAVLYIVIEKLLGIDDTRGILESLKNNFWFLKSLFICFMLMIPFMILDKQFFTQEDKKGFNAQTVILMTGGGICLLFSQLISYSMVCLMFPSFFIGFIVGRCNNWFGNHIYRLGIVSFIVFIMMFSFRENLYNGILDGFAGRIYRIIMGASGAFAILTGFYCLFKKESHSAFVVTCSRWGKETLGIYIVQTYLLEKILSQYLNFDGINFYLVNFIIFPIISLLIMWICILIIRLLKTNKVTAFLLLGVKNS